jgi:hypothetical protein
MLSLGASAEINPPTGRIITVQATRDRGKPAAVTIFNWASGGYDTSDPLKWGRNSWTCESWLNTETGGCRTEPVWSLSGNQTTIELTFKEEKTGATAVLNLTGEASYELHRDCDGNVIPTLATPIRTPIQMAKAETRISCPQIAYEERTLHVHIPAAELRKLPSAGTLWKANLRLNLRQWADSGTSPVLGVFQAMITLNITDENNIQIYLPEFTSATPTIDLKLRKLPNGSRMAGTSIVDMCLYDGRNSQSSWFDVSASDGLTVDRRGQGQYSVLLDSDKSGNYESRVDYTLGLTYEGKKIALPNNETVRLRGVNNSVGRPVLLPGMSVPVICTPTPLTFETPEFQSVWKRSGRYSNKLTITFTPSPVSL